LAQTDSTEKGSAQTGDSAQTTKVIPYIIVLGNLAKINFNPGMSVADKSATRNTLGEGADLINKNEGSLSQSEITAISNVNSINVLNSHEEYMGATGRGSMSISAGYIQNSGAAWMGSILGHEGQHYLNSGKFTGGNLWKDEQKAGIVQLSIGIKIGMPENQQIALSDWINPSNAPAMQKHMLEGFQD